MSSVRVCLQIVASELLGIELVKALLDPSPSRPQHQHEKIYVVGLSRGLNSVRVWQLQLQPRGERAAPGRPPIICSPRRVSLSRSKHFSKYHVVVNGSVVFLLQVPWLVGAVRNHVHFRPGLCG
jgi:hypothetical protein